MKTEVVELLVFTTYLVNENPDTKVIKPQNKLKLDAQSARYPRLYRKIYQPDLNEPFVSRYLTKQSSEKDATEGIHGSAVPDSCWKPYSKVRTVYDIFRQGLLTSRFLPCLGSRTETDRPYTWFVYQEIEQKILDFGSALLNAVGYNPSGHNFVGIYGRNSPEWVVAMQGCAAYAYTFVPLYDTLGKEAVQHIFDQTKLEVLVCHSAKETKHVLNDFVSTIRVIIIVRYDEECERLADQFANRIRIFSFEKFLDIGHSQRRKRQPPAPSDLCEICYTSGSTGTPKGVKITHEQFVDALKGFANTMEEKFLSQMMSHLSYLPLAHILEQAITLTVLLHGARIAYLTTGPTSMMSDIGVVKPTVLTGVPRVFSRIRSEYYKKVPQNACAQKMLQRCITQKVAEQANGKYNHKSMADRLFFKKFRKMMGGSVCVVFSGGAPLPVEVSQFFRAAFNAPVLEGYGSTESTAVVTTTLVGEKVFGIAGAVTWGMEIKLADVPDMGLVSKRDNTGEICLRGPRCTKGYYLNEVETAALYDSDGWMRTGDIGQWTASGALKIVDRCKNMFKLAQGEYVAAEKVEGVYQCCNLVSLIMVDGNPNQTYAVAIVSPDFTVLREQLTGSRNKSGERRRSSVAQRAHFSGMSNEQLCADLEVRKFVLNAMNVVGKEQNLKGFEMVRSIHLTPEVFSSENGLLTPTLKLARYKVRAYFKDAIQQLYLEGELQA